MFRAIAFLLFTIVAVLLPVGPSVADDADTCAKAGGQEGIAACSRAIASGRLSKRGLASAHYNRGVLLLGLDDYDRGISDFDASIEIDPASAWAFNNRGSAWNAKGDFDRALADFSKAISLDPKYALAYNNRGEVFKSRGDLTKAIADYTEAIAIDPGYTAAYANRGLAYEALGDGEKARHDFNTALSGSAKYADGGSAQATARERLGALSDQHKPASVTPGRRVALVIGNSAYAAVPALPNPRHDAEAISAALRADGFETTIVNDASREQLAEALAAFARNAQNADWAMVYFSGHGLEIAGVNYLVPVDARLERDRDVAFQAIALDQVMAAVNSARRLRLVVLDACRVNPFIPAMRISGGSRGPRGLAPPKLAPATLVVYAAKQGQAALDGDSGSSPFAAALARRLPTPGLEINKLFRLVRDDVMDATGGQQEPFTYGSLPGREDYYFAGN